MDRIEKYKEIKHKVPKVLMKEAKGQSIENGKRSEGGGEGETENDLRS